MTEQEQDELVVYCAELMTQYRETLMESIRAGRIKNRTILLSTLTYLIQRDLLDVSVGINPASMEQ